MKEIDVTAVLGLVEERMKRVMGEVVRDALTQQSTGVELAPGRLMLFEAEAAAMLGVRPNVLRDARYRGEIKARKIGRRIGYTRADLEAFLENQRWEQS